LLDGSLASEIEGHVSERQPRAARRNGDDPSAVAHAAARLLQSEKHAPGIDIKHVIIIFLGALDERFLHVNSGVGHDDVEAAQCLFGFIEEPAYLDRFRNVGLDGYRLAAPLHDAIHYGARRLFTSRVIDNDRRATGGKTLGNRASNATRASSYQRSLSIKSSRHKSSKSSQFANRQSPRRLNAAAFPPSVYNKGHAKNFGVLGNALRHRHGRTSRIFDRNLATRAGRIA
jgi:hypothetical protein